MHQNLFTDIDTILEESPDLNEEVPTFSRARSYRTKKARKIKPLSSYLKKILDEGHFQKAF